MTLEIFQLNLKYKNIILMNMKFDCYLINKLSEAWYMRYFNKLKIWELNMKPRVYNYSTLLVEGGKKQKCPKCKGTGTDLKSDYYLCSLCEGKGELIISMNGSGWTKPLGRSIEYSQLYWYETRDL